jgi:hypothetical protein
MPEVQGRHEAQWRQHDNPDQRRGGDGLLEARGRGGVSHNTGQRQAARHVAVNTLHIGSQRRRSSAQRRLARTAVFCPSIHPALVNSAGKLWHDCGVNRAYLSAVERPERNVSINNIAIVISQVAFASLRCSLGNKP